ncbi:MAG: mismatch-specific DNA-glycosylase [Euzebya sp.]
MLGPGLRLLIVGINPGGLSAQTNRHYAGPGNRFWPALSASGLIPHPMGPQDQRSLPRYGIGLTNLVARPSVTAAELRAVELRAGLRQLEAKVADLDPAIIVVLGVTAYRIAAKAPKAVRGAQADRPGWWLDDNPSGLNAHATIPKLAMALASAGRREGLPATPDQSPS